MKKFTLQKLANLVAILLLSSVVLIAQESEITVVKKITKQDGTTTVETEKVVNGENWKETIEKMGNVEGKEVEIHLMSPEGEDVQIESEDGETLIFVRTAKSEREEGDVEEVKVIWHGDERADGLKKINFNHNNHHGNYNYNYSYEEHRDPCKVFIGVGTSEISGNIKVDYTVDDTPARISGVQEGDVILALDNVPVSTQSELVRERDKHEPGDAFTLSIERNGTPMTINAQFRECSEEELQRMEEMREERLQELHERAEKMAFEPVEAERAILGIYPDGGSEEGLEIGSLVNGKGAEAAGLQANDVITTVDGRTVKRTSDLRDALASHKVGDQVPVQYLRDGQLHNTVVTLSSSRTRYSQTTDRDPCAPFIGVYTTVRSGLVTVNGVIENTAAKASGVQPNDIILALDDMPVATQRELEAERDKHEAGENFTLSVMRNGELMKINATFKPCPKNGAIEEPVEEVVEMIVEEEPVLEEEAPASLDLSNQLKVEAFNLFPNPTLGKFNLLFQAEALPTVVRVMDVTGKVIFKEELMKFDGYYNKELDLSGKTPGTYFLTVQQNEKVISRKIILMPRV